jgi:hypothetical protein
MSLCMGLVWHVFAADRPGLWRFGMAPAERQLLDSIGQRGAAAAEKAAAAEAGAAAGPRPAALSLRQLLSIPAVRGIFMMPLVG